MSFLSMANGNDNWGDWAKSSFCLRPVKLNKVISSLFEVTV
jgi:hypothetical protein